MKTACLALAAVALTLAPLQSALASPSVTPPVAAPLPGGLPDTAASAPLSKPAAPIVRFTLGDQEIVAASPIGYCEPSGAATKVTAMMSLWAQKAQLNLGGVWVQCGFHVGQTASIKLALVGGKSIAENIPYSRAVFVKAVADALPTPDGQAAIAKGLANGSAADPDPAATKLDSQPKVVGLDDDAVYLLIDAHRENGTADIGFSLVEALTVLKGKPVVLAFAAVNATPDDKAALLATTKAEVKRLVALN